MKKACLVWSVTLYAAETCTLTEVDRRRLEAFEMWYWRRMERWYWRRMERTGWTDEVANKNMTWRKLKTSKC